MRPAGMHLHCLGLLSASLSNVLSAGVGLLPSRRLTGLLRSFLHKCLWQQLPLLLQPAIVDAGVDHRVMAHTDSAQVHIAPRG